MKNLCKIFGITAMMTVIIISVSSCDDKKDDETPITIAGLEGDWNGIDVYSITIIKDANNNNEGTYELKNNDTIEMTGSVYLNPIRFTVVQLIGSHLTLRYTQWADRDDTLDFTGFNLTAGTLYTNETLLTALDSISDNDSKERAKAIVPNIFGVIPAALSNNELTLTGVSGGPFILN